MTRTIYILGAGFSATCGIATDANMLEELNPLLDDTPPLKLPNLLGTSVDHLREQLFFGQNKIGFETFMSALNSQSFLSECVNSTPPNLFEQAEEEIVRALRKYLQDKVDAATSNGLANPICKFIDRVDWNKDIVITFNYDLLLEKFLEQKQIQPKNEILHLHGSLTDSILIYPNQRKFITSLQKTTFSKRWKDAFDLLLEKRDAEPVNEWIFIGYSMPQTDGEAMGLFAYADFYRLGRNYKISVVNPDPSAIKNYAFFRKEIIYYRLTMEEYLSHHSVK
jgi:hypothetical protein